MKKKKMKILFICKHNRFRSKVAEAFFKKYNKNKNIKINSAGTVPDYLLVAKNVIKALKDSGINRVNRSPKKAVKKLINDSDLIIIVADNVNKEIFKRYKKKIIVWKVSDTSQDNYEEILRIIKAIEKKVNNLVEKLR
jgi:protein-tyrosine-phosphatase